MFGTRSPRVRTAAIFLLGGVLGVFAGAGGMLVAFPFLFPPAPSADAAPIAVAASPSSRFEFDERAPGRDALHWANGNGTLIRTDSGWVLRLEPNFNAGPGPDYWLYFNAQPVGDKKGFEADAGKLRLSKLRSFSGAQNYALPADFDPAKFHTVTIWCEAFGAYIGSGVLRRSDSST
jgi:hypothetical protein